MERGKGSSISVLAWERAAHAAGTDLRAYLDRSSAAEMPRDAVHLADQELVLRVAAGGGWSGRPEFPLGDPLRGCRSADLLLSRATELGLIEVIDWFDDVGATARAWDSRLATVEARAIATLPVDRDIQPTVSGCWIVRATGRNRALVPGTGHICPSFGSGVLMRPT